MIAKKFVLLVGTVAVLGRVSLATPEGAVEVDHHENKGIFGGWFSGPSVDELSKKFPDVPYETIERFHTAFGSDTSNKLSTYIQWRNDIGGKPSTGDDATDWKRAMDDSFTYVSNSKLRGSAHTPIQGNPPQHQVMFDYGVKDYDNNFVLQVIPERMDLSIDRAYEVYSNAIAAYIDTKFVGKSNYEKMTIIVDVRPGRGWANPAILKMMNTVKQICNSITDLQPERIHKIYLFPIPSMATSVWNLIKPFLSKSITENIVMVPGTRFDRHAPIPKDELNKYMTDSVLDILEERRLGLFNPPN